jgi:hypothetical protein
MNGTTNVESVHVHFLRAWTVTCWLFRKVDEEQMFLVPNEPFGVLPLERVDNSTSPCERVLGWMIVIGQSGQATFSEVRLSSSASDGTFTALLAT